MNCNCRNDIEERLTEHYGNPSKLVGYGITLGAKCEEKAYMPIETETKTKTGKTKIVKSNMFFSYCPFCGKEANSKEPT